jgi:hypothetical protein
MKRISIRGDIILDNDPKTKVKFHLESGTHHPRSRLVWDNSINRALDVTVILKSIQETIDREK